MSLVKCIKALFATDTTQKVLLYRSQGFVLLLYETADLGVVTMPVLETTENSTNVQATKLYLDNFLYKDIYYLFIYLCIYLFIYLLVFFYLFIYLPIYLLMHV